MRLLKGAAVVFVAVVAYASSASAAIIDTYSCGGLEACASTDVSEDFGVLAVPGVGDLPNLVQIDRTRVQSTAGSPAATLADDYSFTVDTTAIGATAFTSLVLTSSVGLEDITVTVVDVTNSDAVIATGSATGIGGDTSFQLGLFDLAASTQYRIDVTATVSGTQSGQYDMALEISAIPLPPALVMFGTAIAGLMGFVGFRRKQT